MRRRERGKKEDRRERSGEMGGVPQPPPHFSLGLFILSQFLFGPSNRGQILPSGDCSQVIGPPTNCGQDYFPLPGFLFDGIKLCENNM